jgi:hypothetical protein
MANLLNNYPSQTAVDPALYQDVLWQYMRQVGVADGPTFSLFHGLFITFISIPCPLSITAR